ncbi:MAG TPA: SDR family oxidoreductase, partial [Acidimicrobiales bacterium]|nr:SDR family oxidoreductase [Acidimicrobiales bacterium]
MPQTGPLEGHTALVTGASRGIGAATARALDRAGARLAVVSRGGPDLDEVAAALGHRPLALAADLRQADAPGQVAARVLDGFGSVDILVNNAALAARLDTVDTEAALIDELLAVNV